MNTTQADPAEISRALDLILEPGGVTELRALDATTPSYRKPHTESGYFNDPAALVAAVGQITSAKGIYIVLNPIVPALLARAANRVKAADKGGTTGDGDILRRRWLPVDCDPVRPAGISATDAEHEAALERACAIQSELTRQGWPKPIIGDSGNGAHLLYLVDLPADDGGLVERCLRAIAKAHGDQSVSVDTSVHNAARIWKLYGTWARKGDSTPDRPHRMAKIYDEPAKVEVVPAALLETLAAEAPQAEAPAARVAHGGAAVGDGRDWLDSFLARNVGRLPKMSEWESYNGGRRRVFDACPWNPQHVNGSAFLIQRADGAIQAGCHHNGCKAETWHTLRAMIEPKATPAATRTTATGATPLVVTEPAPVLVRLSDVAPVPVRWLWPGRIAIGKVTMLAGDPGLGKSFLTLDMTARVSTGTPWPDSPTLLNPVGGVVLLNCEDDLADTIRPRLDNMAANCTRIIALAGVRLVNEETGKAMERAFSLELDLPRLEAAIVAVPGCRLVVIDPITAYLGETDSHKNAEIRALLAPLGELAARRGVAVVCVTHLNKGSGPAIYRTMGSLAFVAAARAAWAVTKDKKDPEERRRLMLPVKNNIGPDNTGLAYRLENGRVVWEADPVTDTADEALAPEGDGVPGPDPEAREEAVKWLRKALADGPMLATDVQKQSRHCGISVSTLNRAKREAEVETHRPVNPGPWYWGLPGCTWPTPRKEPTPSEPGDLDNVPVNTGDSEGGKGAHGQVPGSGNLLPAEGLGAGIPDTPPKRRRARKTPPADAGMRTPNKPGEDRIK